MNPTFSGSIRRRDFLAGAALATLAGCTPNAGESGIQQPSEVPEGNRILIRNACVLSMDPGIGDFDRADVLIEGTRIAAVGPDLDVTPDAVIDGTHRISSSFSLRRNNGNCEVPVN
jgi:hypothetical protein